MEWKCWCTGASWGDGALFVVRRATDIQGGAAYGYKLLIAILLSNFAAMFLQFLSLKLGVVAERDLAQACRDGLAPCP